LFQGAALAAASALSLSLLSTSARAEADCKALVNPSPFGPNDQVGATNRIAPEVTKAAAAEIKTGQVIPMANVLVDGVPLFGTRFTKTALTSFATMPVVEFGKNCKTSRPRGSACGSTSGSGAPAGGYAKR
jgi:hypothetical protein